MAITFVTITSYGSWLPGDLRGYVQGGAILPGNPRLLKFTRLSLKGAPVLFGPQEQDRLFNSLLVAADEFGYRVTDACVEPWHLHWIVGHGDEPTDAVVGRLKTRMQQSLGRGRIWTKGYCRVPLLDGVALQQAREYIARHRGCRLAAGVRQCVFVGRSHGKAVG